MYFRLLAFHVLLCSLFASCTKSDEDAVADIEAYASQKGWTLTDTAGVYVYIDSAGGPERPNANQTIEFEYVASYLDDVVFDATVTGVPVQLSLAIAMNGLKKGLPFFGREGKGYIFVPPAQGYKNNPPFGVKEGVVLVYRVHVRDFY